VGDQVKLKPTKVKVAGSAIKAVLRLSAATARPWPKPVEESPPEPEPEPVKVRGSLRVDPSVRAAAQAEHAKKESAVVTAEVKAARQKFDEMDTDGNGTLDKAEVGELSRWALTSFLKSEDTLQLTPTQQAAEVDKLMVDTDKNGDGKVDFEEFAAWFTPTCKKIQAFRANEAKKNAQKKAQKKAANVTTDDAPKKRAVAVSGPALGLRKQTRGSAGLAACCGTPQAHGRPVKAPAQQPAAKPTAGDEDSEPPVDMEHRRQHIDGPAQSAAQNDDAEAAATPAAAATASSPTPGSPGATPARPAQKPVDRTRSATPPRMTRAGLAARMEQARALSPRRTASAGRASTPPRSGTPPRRKVITSDELGTKIASVRA